MQVSWLNIAVLSLLVSSWSWARLEVCNRPQNTFDENADVDLYRTGSFNGPMWREWIALGNDPTKPALFIKKSWTRIETKIGSDEEPMSWSLHLIVPDVNGGQRHMDVSFSSKLVFGDFSTTHTIMPYVPTDGMCSGALAGPDLCDAENCIEQPTSIDVKLGITSIEPFYENSAVMEGSMATVSKEVAYWPVALTEQVVAKVVPSERLFETLGCLVFD